MSWLTRGTNSATALTTWSTGQVPSASDWNAIGLDLRTWGNNVDAGGNSLVNVAQVSVAPTGSTGLVVNGAGGSNHQFKVGGVSKGYIGYAPLGTTGIAVLDPAGTGALMMITAAGNVGIGTASPGSKLDVIGGNVSVDYLSAYQGRNSVGAAYPVVGTVATNQTFVRAIDNGPASGVRIEAWGATLLAFFQQGGLWKFGVQPPTYASNAAASAALGGAGWIYTDGAGALKVTF